MGSTPIRIANYSEETMAEITEMLLTNSAYGYPDRGDARRLRAALLICMHITDNDTNVGPNAAENERNYANRVGSNGPSAHYYLNRDGSGVKAIDPATYAAWSNGIIAAPKTNFFGYNMLNDLYIENGYNANEAFLLEIECCGSFPANPITQEQKDTIAELMARYSISYGIDINRNTVWTHSDINSVNRRNDPVLYADKEVFIKEIIALAKHKKNGIISAPVTAQLEACTAANIELADMINEQEKIITSQEEEIADLEAENDELKTNLEQCSNELKDLEDQFVETRAAWKTLNENLSS